MNKKNYQKIMEDLIRENCTAGEAPSLLLHSCCAPCSSYCIACLAEHFHVTVFYYNPNIYPPEEYHMRAKEQERFIAEFPTKYPVSFVEGAYDTQRFYDMAKGMEEIPEGGERCFACYRLRLSEAASYAKAHGFDFFTTTLSISPLKNAQKFLADGNRVKVSVRFRGREMAHTDIGRDLLKKFAELCADVATMDKSAKMEGRLMSMFLSPKAQKAGK